MGIQHTFTILKTTVHKFASHNGLFLASGLAFDLLLYSIPLSLLIVSMLGYALAGSESAMSGLKDVLQQLFPVTDDVISENVSKVVVKRGRLGLLGMVVFLIWGSTTIASVRTVLNIIFEIKTPRGYLRGKGLDLVILLGLSLLIILTVGAGSLLAMVQNLGERLPYLRNLLNPGWLILSRLIGVLFTFSLFYIVYRFCPARALSGKSLLIACGTATGLFELSKWAFTWYISLAQNYTVLYGTLSGLVFFFLWLYYASIVFVLAATLGWVFEHSREGVA
jgi:membrane protein